MPAAELQQCAYESLLPIRRRSRRESLREVIAEFVAVVVTLEGGAEPLCVRCVGASMEEREVHDIAGDLPGKHT